MQSLILPPRTRARRDAQKSVRLELESIWMESAVVKNVCKRVLTLWVKLGSPRVRTHITHIPAPNLLGPCARHPSIHPFIRLRTILLESQIRFKFNFANLNSLEIQGRIGIRSVFENLEIRRLEWREFVRFGVASTAPQAALAIFQNFDDFSKIL